MTAMSSAASGATTVLSIDDSATVRLFIQMALRRRPHLTVLVAETGKHGIQLAQDHVPALILLDGSLPDIGGLDVLRVLKGSAATRRIPVVVLTGGGREAPDTFLAAGAEEILIKPIDLHDLYALVDRHASSRP